MVKFPSEEWAKAYRDALNSDEGYNAAAAKWQGDFIFIITPDENLSREYIFYLDLSDGQCSAAQALVSREEKEAEFTFEGSYSNWKKLLTGETDHIKGLITRKFKLKGNALKAAVIAKELLGVARRIPTEFL